MSDVIQDDVLRLSDFCHKNNISYTLMFEQKTGVVVSMVDGDKALAFHRFFRKVRESMGIHEAPRMNRDYFTTRNHNDEGCVTYIIPSEVMHHWLDRNFKLVVYLAGQFVTLVVSEKDKGDIHSFVNLLSSVKFNPHYTREKLYEIINSHDLSQLELSELPAGLYIGH